MNLPSIEAIAKGARRTTTRFPLALLAAIIGTITLIVAVENDLWWQSDGSIKIFMTSALGLPLFVALTCLAEKRRWSAISSLGIQGFFAAILIVYYFLLPEKIIDQPLPWTRWLFLWIGLHFSVAVLPFLGRHGQGFWQFNKTLFLRFAHAALYSSVLYSGLAIALLALDYLFGVDIDGDRYAQLWLLMAGIFNTWLFLSWVPKDLNALDDDQDYPKGLKAFSQFALIPLVILYFAILITYEAKILVLWDWPKGWVGQLVLWYAVVGILSLLLLYPLRKIEGSKWIAVFVRWFFYAQVPLIVMLFIAIYIRIADYGLTPPRYSVVAMAVGLTVITLYFIVSRQKDIRIIPLVTVLLAFLSSFGPWGALATSECSQQARFEQLLIENELWSAEVGITPRQDIDKETEREISKQLNYLYDWYGSSTFSKWYPTELLTEVDHKLESDTTESELWPDRHLRTILATTLGLTVPKIRYTERGFSDRDWFSFWTTPSKAMSIEDYDYLIDLGKLSSLFEGTSFALGEDSCRVYYDDNGQALRVKFLSSDINLVSSAISLAGPINALVVDNQRNREVSADSLVFTCEDGCTGCLLQIERITGHAADNRIDITNLSGYLLIRMPDKVDSKR